MNQQAIQQRKMGFRFATKISNMLDQHVTKEHYTFKPKWDENKKVEASKLTIKDYKITGEFVYDAETYTVQAHASGDLEMLEMNVKPSASSTMGANGVRVHRLSKAYTAHCNEHQQKFYYHIRRKADWSEGVSFSEFEMSTLKKNKEDYSFEHILKTGPSGGKANLLSQSKQLGKYKTIKFEPKTDTVHFTKDGKKPFNMDRASWMKFLSVIDELLEDDPEKSVEQISLLNAKVINEVEEEDGEEEDAEEDEETSDALSVSSLDEENDLAIKSQDEQEPIPFLNDKEEAVNEAANPTTEAAALSVEFTPPAKLKIKTSGANRSIRKRQKVEDKNKQAGKSARKELFVGGQSF